LEDFLCFAAIFCLALSFFHRVFFILHDDDDCLSKKRRTNEGTLQVAALARGSLSFKTNDKPRNNREGTHQTENRHEKEHSEDASKQLS
jgi:hypothetical protein